MANHKSSIKRIRQEEKMIDCCGCGNWELIENLIEDVDNLKWNCLDESNNLTFGKYKGQGAKKYLFHITRVS